VFCFFCTALLWLIHLSGCSTAGSDRTLNLSVDEIERSGEIPVTDTSSEASNASSGQVAGVRDREPRNRGRRGGGKNAGNPRWKAKSALNSDGFSKIRFLTFPSVL